MVKRSWLAKVLLAFVIIFGSLAYSTEAVAAPEGGKCTKDGAFDINEEGALSTHKWEWDDGEQIPEGNVPGTSTIYTTVVFEDETCVWKNDWNALGREMTLESRGPTPASYGENCGLDDSGKPIEEGSEEVNNIDILENDVREVRYDGYRCVYEGVGTAGNPEWELQETVGTFTEVPAGGGGGGPVVRAPTAQAVLETDNIQFLSNGLAWYALAAAVIGIFISASLWALGSKGQNPGQELTGKRGIIVCLAAAFAVGALNPFMGALQDMAAQVENQVNSSGQVVDGGSGATYGSANAAERAAQSGGAGAGGGTAANLDQVDP